MDRKIVEQLITGRGVNAICRDLHVGKRRVAHLREKAREYGYLEGRLPLPPYPEALFPDPIDGRSVRRSETELRLEKIREWIVERLCAGWQPITIFEELPVAVSRPGFYRYLHRHQLTRLGESTRKTHRQEIIHGPGEALIVDWGKLRNAVDPVTRKNRTLWMFVGLLGHSRYLMVRLVWSHDVDTTLAILESMIKELGGVVCRIVSDNPKCFVLEASKYEPLLNPAYERFAAHYATTIECLPPASPELKGKVERMMPFIRRLYQAHGDEWHGLSESQAYLDRKVAIANERIHGTTRRRPIDLFLEEEAAALKPLPALAYEVEAFHEGKVRKDGHVRFRNKYYSVEERYRGEKVEVIGNTKQISIYHKGKLIEVHGRITDPYITKNTKPTHMAPWERAISDGSIYRERAARLGADVEKMVLHWLLNGNGFIDTRKIWGVLSLDKKYTPESINGACRHALSIKAYSYRTILSFLKLDAKSERKRPPAMPQKPDSSKFARSMEEYQALLNP